MTLVRGVFRRRHASLGELLAEFSRDVDEDRAARVARLREEAARLRGEMPPRPQLREPASGPDIRPRLFAPDGPVDPRFDPTGAPPLNAGNGAGEKGAAPC